jgi:hypothetical protein
MVLLCEFAIAMKTVVRYSLIIFTLGIFSSCAERFTSRGEAPKGFYSSSSSADRSLSLTQKQKVFLNNLHRDTVRYAHEKLMASTAPKKTALTECAHTNNLKSPNSISSGILLGDSFGGSPITSEKSLKKVEKRFRSPYFSPIKSFGINKVNSFFKQEKGESKKHKNYLELPGDSAGDWILFLNLISVILVAIGLLLFSIYDPEIFIFFAVWLIPTMVTVLQYTMMETISDYPLFSRILFWLLALVISTITALMILYLIFAALWEFG